MYKAFWRLKTITDTEALAKKLAAALSPSAIVALTGDLGAGKTTFAQHLAKALGVTEFLPSPTFTLMNEYIINDTTLIHADWYRLHSVEEIRQLGITDYFAAPHTITVVEWADRAAALFPPVTIWLDFALVDDNERVVTINSQNQDFWNHFYIEVVP